MNTDPELPSNTEEDFSDTLSELPDNVDRRDPLFQQAYKEVMQGRIERLQRSVSTRPKALSGQKRPYRPELPRLRRIFSKLSLALVFISAVLYSASYFGSAALISVLAIAAAVILSAYLLGEVLFGSGTDIHTQYMGPAGPSREYSFKPSIGGPVPLFALIGNVIGGIVLGYAEVYLSLASKHLIGFSKNLDIVSAIYFSLVTFATVGYGDFYPDSLLAKLLVCSEIIVALFILAVVLSTSTSWLLSRREELSAERKTRNASEMQNVERLIKEAGVGLYQDDAEILKEVLARMEELRRKRIPEAN